MPGAAHLGAVRQQETDMTSTIDTDTYALRTRTLADVAAPDIAYEPPTPRKYRPRIGLIGAGGIAAAHLDAYRTAGWEVAAICNRTLSKAEGLRDAYYPAARVCTDLAEILGDPDIDVVDITPHPADRVPIIRAALTAGKHVLSQKPFVLDLDEGTELVRLARDNGCKLAVNQNGRWAPHMAWMRGAVAAGHLGTVTGVAAQMHWDHGWIAGTPFDSVEDLILYDFGIHWFDFVTSIIGNGATWVFADARHAVGQAAKVPLMGQALIGFDGGQASLIFDGVARHGPRDTTQITGTDGSLASDGPNLGEQSVSLTTAAGVARPALTGTWFNDGFRGAMGALLCAIEDDTEPGNGAAANLDSLALAFAAIRSAQTGARVDVGSVRRIGA